MSCQFACVNVTNVVGVNLALSVNAATTRAVVHSAVAILVANYIITSLLTDI